jgi:hypothetical protein
LYHRELKLDARNEPVLASQTPETALQEIAALVLAGAVPRKTDQPSHTGAVQIKLARV